MGRTVLRRTLADADEVVAVSHIPPVPSPLLAVRDGIVVEINALAAATLGRDAHDVVGVALRDLVDTADREPVTDLLAAADPRATTVVVVPPGADVDRRRVELRAAPGDDGTVLVALQDRTEERLLHAIIDAVADTTLVLDSSGLVKWQSLATSAQFPGGPEKAIGFNPMERIHPEDLPTVLEATATALAEPGIRLRHIARSRSVENDDAWQVIEMTGINTIEDPEIRAFIVQVRDVDDPTEIESLASTDTQFLSLADAAPMGIVVSDLVGRTVYRNTAAKDLLGQPQLRPDRDWRELASGAAREQLDALFAESAASGQPRSITVPFESDGRDRWLRVRLAPRLTVGAGNVYMIATLEDVSAEIEARAETDRLTHMLDATSDYVAVFRPDGEILYVNAATRALLESIQGETTDLDLRDLLDQSSRQQLIDAAIVEFATTDVWQGNLELNAGEGRTIPVSATGLIRRLPDGELDWIAIHGRDISELKEAENLLRELASHDHLTGLANRALFNERLDRAVARHRRDGAGVAVMFCDLDRFKAINDGHGHAAGDLVLSVIADRLRLVTRETDTTARVGGDEFVIVCEGITDVAELELLAQRVIDAVNGPITLPEVGRTAQPPVRIRVGISVGIGVAGAEHAEVDPDRLLTLADTAMYEAKAAGGAAAVVAHLDR